jgi:tetratricopeptide (TPR) repeat protein
VEVGNRAGEGRAYGYLGNAHHSLGDYHKALEYFRQHLAIAVEGGDRAGEGKAYNNMALSQLRSGQSHQAAAQASRAVEVFVQLEREVDDKALRMSLFAQQVSSYGILQAALLETERAGPALAVAEQSKARVLSGALSGDAEMPLAMPHNVEGAPESADPYRASWEEVQRLAQQEGSGTRIVEYSFHARGLAVWVLSSAGELLCSMALSTAGKGKESKKVEDAGGKLT